MLAIVGGFQCMQIIGEFGWVAVAADGDGGVVQLALAADEELT